MGAIISSLAEGFGSLKTEGLCGANIPVDDDDDEEDEEEEDGAGSVDRYDIVDEDDNKADSKAEKMEDCRETSEVPLPTADLHAETVLKVIDQAETDCDKNWRNWIDHHSGSSHAITTTTDSDQ